MAIGSKYKMASNLNSGVVMFGKLNQGASKTGWKLMSPMKRQRT